MEKGVSGAMLKWNELSLDKQKLSEEEMYFLFKIEEGWNQKLSRLFGKTPEKFSIYWSRLKEEVAVILRMRFPGYFLITQDFLKWADEVKIRRGVGRGSAGGSLIAFVLDITKVDPIKYNLLFSRFLNADRVSMPDIDNDIETDRRDEIKQYLKRKYGEDRVASIGTFGTMKVRACIKDIIRSLNIGGNKTEAFKLADQVNSTMPNDADITFDDACKQSLEFKSLVWYPTEEELSNGWKERIEKGEKPSKFWQVGFHLRKMEGMIRQTGTHAAGVIVAPTKLSTILPMAVDKNGVTVTANPGKMVEDAGFLKIDLLGLNTLSIIQKCVDNIKETQGVELKGIPLNGIPLVEGENPGDFQERLKGKSKSVIEASKAYHLLRSGKTLGIFQCESSVATSLLQDLQVNSIEDISIVLALNRPGPLKAGLVGEFGDRKFGKISIPEYHPAVDKVLKDTYNVIVFQEQVMQLAVECAGFTMSAADTLRKACGKKIKELMDKMKEEFIEGCYKNHEGFDKEVEYEILEEDQNGNPQKVTKRGTIAQRLWNEVTFFASYGFNASHSVSYAHNTYYTAFLKANYPAEFWAAQLSYESDQVKINKMIREAQNSGIKILPVDINKSQLGYKAESPTSVRRSFGTLKSVGATAIEELCNKRPFKNPVDFLIKCDMRKINKKTVHALICAGAFDNFGITRKVLDEKIQDCKFKLDKWCKRRVSNYIKFVGAYKNCISKPVEEDLELLASPDDDEKMNSENPKYLQVRDASKEILEEWQSTKQSLNSEDTESFTKELKNFISKWQRVANGIFQDNEWEYIFTSTEEDKNEWPLNVLIQNEKEVYGTCVSAHLFDKYKDIEDKVIERFPTNYLTLDQELEGLSHGMEVVMMVEVLGLSRQFPYKKDASKFVRLFRIEDRYGSIDMTVFEQTYDDFIENEQNIPIRVLSAGNVLIIKAKVNLYNGRKSLVYSKCLKFIASASAGK